MKIDLLKIDMEKGKHWMQQVQEERIAKKREAIRDKHRRKRAEELKRETTRSR